MGKEREREKHRLQTLINFMAYAIPQTTRISECSRPSWKLYYLHGALGLLNAYERLLGCISEASWRAIRCFWVSEGLGGRAFWDLFVASWAFGASCWAFWIHSAAPCGRLGGSWALGGS